MSWMVRNRLKRKLLDVIARKGPLYGLEIVRTVEHESEGEVKLTANDLYPPLHDFERRGMINVEHSSSPWGKGSVNYYTLTEEGQRVLAAQRESEATSFWERWFR